MTEFLDKNKSLFLFTQTSLLLAAELFPFVEKYFLTYFHMLFVRIGIKLP